MDAVTRVQILDVIVCIWHNPWKRYASNYLSIVGQTGLFNLGMVTGSSPEISPHHHHHHQVVQQSRVSLTLSRHSSLSSIAPGKSSRLHLARLSWIVSWWVVSVRKAAALCDAAFRTCSILLAVFLCNCRQAFSPSAYLVFLWCIHIAVLIWLLLGKNFHMTNRLSIVFHAFVSCVLISFSIKETLLLR